MRILLTYVVPLVLPTVLYFAWAWWDGQHPRSTAGQVAERTTPWFWLIIAGFVLTLLVLAYTAYSRGGPAGSRIIPPRLEDGRVVPAQIE